MIKESCSTQQRNFGNAKFKQYKYEAEAFINRSRLNEAIVFYDNALRTSNNDEERYKASKNIGLAYEKMIETCDQENLTIHKHFLNYHYYLKQMCLSHDQTIQYGERYLKTSDYSAQKERIEKSMSNNLNKLTSLNKISYLQSIAEFIKQHHQIYFYLIAAIARLYFNEGIFYMNIKQYVVAKTYFYQSRQLLDIYFIQSNMNAMDQRTINEFNDISHSCNFYIRRAQVITILKEAKSYFNKAIYDEDQIDMDYCYISLTKYREALLYFQGDKDSDDRKASDIELEAICIGKIAYVMYNVFKNDNKAYALAMESITLGLSLYPKNIMSEKWFINVQNISIEIRDKRAKEEEKSTQTIYLEFKKNNEALIQEIDNESKKDYKSFIKFCISKYPYGIKDFTNQLNDLTKKKALLKMIVHYHPDGQGRNNEEETKIYFIKQEITKHFNSLYNHEKECN